VVLAQCLFISEWEVWPFGLGLILFLAVFRKRWLAAFLCCFSWVTFSLQVHIADRLDATLSGSLQEVQGRIAGLPQVYDDFTRFRFEPAYSPWTVELPDALLAYWYQDVPVLQPGETWLLELQLKPPWGQVNFQGGDRERWLFAEKIGGLATVKSGTRLHASPGGPYKPDSFRHLVREQLASAIGNRDERAIVTALALADRSGMEAWQRNVLSQTGTAHLLAISGLHVGLAAMLGFWLFRCPLSILPPRWVQGLAYPVSIAGGLALAVGYAALAGFGTSTIRALLMLAAGTIAVLLRRTIHPGQSWFIALLTILLLDPLSFLNAGFWLSFSAVGVMLLLFSKGVSSRQAWWLQPVRAQAGIMLVLLPMCAWWFQTASMIGLVANLLAIPFVSIVVVPLILLGLMVLPISAAFSAMAFSTAAVSVGWLFELLQWMAGLPHSSVGMQQPSLWTLLAAMSGALMLLLLRGVPHRWLGIVLMLPLAATDRPPRPGEIRIDVLDVGQGTSVLISSANHLLVYDTGPGNGRGFDFAETVIRPAILHSGHAAPETIVVSHADLDHAGGLDSLAKLYPGAAAYGSFSNLPDGVESCDDTLVWQWDGLEFSVLHPSPWLPYLGNDSSCTVGITMGRIAIILPGDISGTVERRLLLQGRLPGVDILLVPHHGSRSSSSDSFLSALHPRVAIATAGLGNRFGFPLPEIRQRYQDRGIDFWSTDACGAVRVNVSEAGGIQATSARRSRPAPWRWPAAESCP